MRALNSSRAAARLALDHEGGDAGLAGARQTEGVGLVGDDAGDLGGQGAGGDAVEEVLQCRAAAAEQNGQPDGMVHDEPSAPQAV